VRLWRGLGRRLLWAAVACGLAGVASSIVATSSLATEALAGRIGPALAVLVRRDAAHCDAAPEAWTIRAPGGVEAYAYPADALRSPHPDAPPLDGRLAAELADGRPAAVRIRFGDPKGGALAFRVRDAGPCARVQIVWRRDIPYRLSMLAGLVVVAFISIGGVAFVSGRQILRPLLARIERTAEAAARLGEADAVLPAPSEDEDELDRVVAGMQRAHTRILDDAAAERARRDALVRHLADLAHDLKTPLASLSLALDAALEAAVDEAQQAELRRALVEVRDVSDLIDDLRTAAQLREGIDPLDGDPSTDLSELVERVGARLAPIARGAGIAVEIATPDDPVLVRCRSTMAAQAVANLAKNAVVYNDRGGHVAIVLERSDRDFELRVLDDGPGVPPEILPRLEDRHFRHDEARQRAPDGSGLGLAITAEVCRRAGWTLALEAHAPRGLCATIRGPLRD
jgi:signal transduction histidine kinase